MRVKKIYEKIKLVEIKRDIQTDEVWYELQAKYLGKIVTKIIPRSEFTVKGLRALTSFGFPFLDDKEAYSFISKVQKNEERYTLKDTFKTVGWHTIENKNCFLHRQLLKDNKECPVYYNGEFDISAQGSLDAEIIFFNETIAKEIGLQVICAVSLASAIVGMIKEKDLKFIFHIEGTSTTGKTTSLMLAGSMWGKPNISANGIIKNWNTTTNKLIQNAGGNKGILIGLDELSMAKADNTQLTYLLTGGMDKQRMTENNGADNEFRTIFMSTGEIQFKTTNFTGISVRLFEVKNYNFTKNKETADLITASIQKNYGNIGFSFAKALTDYSARYIQEKIENMTPKIIKRIEYYVKKQGKSYSPLLSRMAEKIATIAFAAHFAKQKLNMKFNIKDIVDFLICGTTLLENGQEQAVEAVEKFLEEYTKNQTKFPEDSKGNQSNIWGKSVVKNGDLAEIVVLYNKFIEIMNKIGYPDTNSLIKALKEKKFIKCEKDKNYSRRNVGNISKAKVIVINILAVKGGADNED